MRTITAIVCLSAALSNATTAAELSGDLIGCIDGDALYLLNKYKDEGNVKAMDKVINGGLCRSRSPDTCPDEEVAFMLSGASGRGDIAYVEKIVSGGLCRLLPAGSQYSIVEDGVFVSVITLHPSGETIFTHLPK